jgi:hypothetical protein
MGASLVPEQACEHPRRRLNSSSPEEKDAASIEQQRRPSELSGLGGWCLSADPFAIASSASLKIRQYSSLGLLALARSRPKYTTLLQLFAKEADVRCLEVLARSAGGCRVAAHAEPRQASQVDRRR